MTKLPLLIGLMAALAAPLAHAGAQKAAQPNVPANLAAVEGVTVTGQRCTLATRGCACRETDAACVRAVADDMRLYFPRQYLAMASRCMRDDTLMARYKVAASNDALGQEANPAYGHDLVEAASHKVFCDKAYADADGVAAALQAQAAR